MAHNHAKRTTSGPITYAVAILAPWMVACSLSGGTEAATSVTTADGGSIQTKLKYFSLNEKSSLRREWVAVHDDSLAVDLIDTPGVTTTYKSQKYSSGFRYNASYSIMVHEPTVAIEVRFIIFDVWGNSTGTLTATEIRDFAPGRYELDAVWNLSSENEAAKFYTSVAYVATVRTKAGNIQYADTEAVIEAAQHYMIDYTSDLLDGASSEFGQGN